MGKKVHNTVLDAALNEVAKADQLIACDSEPVDYADATTLVSNGGAKLGSVAMASGDFTISDGDTSGRKVTVAGKTLSIDESGDVTHLALVDDAGSVLLHVTTFPTTSVSAGGSLSTNPYDEEIEDPT